MDPICRPLKRRSVPFQGLKRSPRGKARAQAPDVATAGAPATATEASELANPTTSPVQAPAADAPEEEGAEGEEEGEARIEECVWRVCLAVRFINSLLVQTYFDPEEHWQVREAAHRTTFGYGHLTWELQRGLLSYVHPLVFAVLYKMLDVLDLGNPWFMVLYISSSLCVADWLMLQALCLGLMTLVDRLMYGKWTFVMVNFFKFNFLSSGGAFYGTHPWHWYISQGLPVMAFTFLPLSLAGMWWSQQWELCGLIAWILAIYSTLGHKEFRFVLPVLPLVMMYAGYAIAVLEQRWAWEGPQYDNSYKLHLKDPDRGTDGPPGFWARITSAVKYRKRFVIGAQKGDKRLWGVFMSLLLTNLPAALYTSLIHQRGSETVMEDLACNAQAGLVESVLFLMPCQATPYYSSLHTNVSMRFLDCSPSDEPDHVDEVDRFMAHPVSFLYSMFGSEDALLPSHIVLFDSMEKRVSMFLKMENYVLDKKFFHAHLPVDHELQAHVLVYTRPSKATECSWFPW